jgi:hypothetical protein
MQKKVKLQLIATSSSPNILFIIADDMGKDTTNGFLEGSIKPTPTIDNIKTQDLVFTNFCLRLLVPYSCSIDYRKIWLPDCKMGKRCTQILKQFTKYINQQTNNKYATAVIGKWHLAGADSHI